jgi:hypothetical protein
MYAGFWNRFAATFLDGLVILVVEILLLTVLPATGVMAVGARLPQSRPGQIGA